MADGDEHKNFSILAFDIANNFLNSERRHMDNNYGKGLWLSPLISDGWYYKETPKL